MSCCGYGNNTEWKKGGAKLIYGKKKVSELNLPGAVYGQARSCRRQVQNGRRGVMDWADGGVKNSGSAPLSPQIDGLP